MLLKVYRQKFEKELLSAIERFGEKSPLRDACEYALVSEGKRLRPLIVMMTADALSNHLNVLPAALGVEFFHTASLIADDLPCMDNDALRRSRLSLHKAFGEATAILASYTLIAEGYGGIYLNQEEMSRNSQFSSKASNVSSLCLSAATRCAGIQGATSGQHLDLFPPDNSWRTIQKVIVQKTVTLFEISFLFGWLFGGGSPSSIRELRDLAYHLGMAFQIADDLQDDMQDGKNSMNISRLLGKDKALSLLEKESISLQNSLKRLRLWTEPFQELYELSFHDSRFRYSSC